MLLKLMRGLSDWRIFLFWMKLEREHSWNRKESRTNKINSIPAPFDRVSTRRAFRKPNSVKIGARKI